MNKEVLDELLKARSAILPSIQAAETNIKTLTDAARKPLSVAEAKMFVRKIWPNDPQLASGVLVRLSDATPEDNSNALFWVRIPNETLKSLKGDLEPAIQLVRSAQGCLLGLVQEAVEALKCSGAYDEAAQTRYDQFRKEVIRYLDFSNRLVSATGTEELVEWTSLTEECEPVSNGDYLFIDDLDEKILAAHKELESRLLVDESDATLGSLEWRADDWVNCINLPISFIRYLGCYLGHFTE